MHGNPEPTTSARVIGRRKFETRPSAYGEGECVWLIFMSDGAVRWEPTRLVDVFTGKDVPLEAWFAPEEEAN